jgi:hypothetical protein
MIELKLKLSNRGAKALRAMAGRVGGSPEGPRGVASEIYDALSEILGIEPRSNESATISDAYVKYGSLSMAKEWPGDENKDCIIEY